MKMILLTMLARVTDGLPLAASMSDDEEVFYFLFFASVGRNLFSLYHSFRHQCCSFHCCFEKISEPLMVSVK